MSKVVSAKFGNGNITYFGKVDPTPDTSKTTKNVTVNMQGSPGQPAHFSTSFMIKVTMEDGGVETTNIFHWDDVVLEKPDSSGYREVEDAAARQLAPALRAVADLIDQEILRFENTPGEPPES